MSIEIDYNEISPSNGSHRSMPFGFFRMFSFKTVRLFQMDFFFFVCSFCDANHHQQQNKQQQVNNRRHLHNTIDVDQLDNKAIAKPILRRIFNDTLWIGEVMTLVLI